VRAAAGPQVEIHVWVGCQLALRVLHDFFATKEPARGQRTIAGKESWYTLNSSLTPAAKHGPCSMQAYRVEPATTTVATPGCNRCSFCPGAIAHVPFRLVSVTSMLLLHSCNSSTACCLLMRPRSSGWSGRPTSAFGPARPRTELLLCMCMFALGPSCMVRQRSMKCCAWILLVLYCTGVQR
jgi:hypothetical protein